MLDTIDYLVQSNNLSKLFGEQPMEQVQPMLLEFWRRYSLEWPDYGVFRAAAENKLSLSRTIPVYIHGDEGRGFKRSGVMILSLQGAIGRGSKPFLKRHPIRSLRQLKMGINLQGSSFNSRMLFVAMPKKHYKAKPDSGTMILFIFYPLRLPLVVLSCDINFNPTQPPILTQENFQAVLNKMINDLLKLQDIGFTYAGERWNIACLGVKGDLPFLRTVGDLTRHWQRAHRSEENKSPPGVCWMCLAGTKPGGPFEDFNIDAQWSVVATVDPWVTRPSVLQLFHCIDRPHDYLKTDVWHNYHGGAGKTFIASVLAECLLLLPGSREDKISQLDVLLRQWAKRPGCNLPHSGPFVAERIGLTSFQVLPEGGWSKFADTHIYHRFVEWFLTGRINQFNEDEYFLMILEAVKAANDTFSIRYSSGLWLTSNEALAAGNNGRKWLRIYANLAYRCFTERKSRFPIYVKFHMLDHHWRRLVSGAQNKWTLNILAESVQADEESSLNLFEF